jgi:iron complex transport system permease protein
MLRTATAEPPVADRRRSPHLVSGPAYLLLMAGLGATLVLAVGFAVGVGTVSVPLADVAGVVWAHARGDTAALDPLTDQIVWDFRIPRVLLAAVAGAGLSVAGVCLQALVRNPLADPYLLGISSGASLGAVAVLTATSAAVAAAGVAGAAFAGAVVSLLLVFALAQRRGRVTASRLVLAGVAIGYVGAAATSYLQLKANPSELRGVMFWLLGSLAGAAWTDLGVPSAAIAVCLAWLLLQGRRMNALTMGDDAAAGLGVDVQRIRIVLLVVASVLTASVVSVCGGIGFVGLMVPHAVRLVVGPDHRKLLPASLLTGAVFLVVVDLVSRTVDRPNEMPIGIFTAALGAPFFLWLLRRQNREYR